LDGFEQSSLEVAFCRHFTRLWNHQTLKPEDPASLIDDASSVGMKPRE
jgi:hypothetical protein